MINFIDICLVPMPSRKPWQHDPRCTKKPANTARRGGRKGSVSRQPVVEIDKGISSLSSINTHLTIVIETPRKKGKRPRIVMSSSESDMEVKNTGTLWSSDMDGKKLFPCCIISPYHTCNRL